MKPLLLNLKDNFICVKPKEIPYLNSKYSIRFYLLIRKYQFMRKKYFEINIDELRTMFGLEEKLKDFGSFKKHVLEPAKLELENTLSAFEYKAVRAYKSRYETIGFTLKHRYKTIKKSLNQKSSFDFAVDQELS
jgi:plasmid replication initiation protein